MLTDAGAAYCMYLFMKCAMNFVTIYHFISTNYISSYNPDRENVNKRSRVYIYMLAPVA